MQYPKMWWIDNMVGNVRKGQKFGEFSGMHQPQRAVFSNWGTIITTTTDHCYYTSPPIIAASSTEY